MNNLKREIEILLKNQGAELVRFVSISHLDERQNRQLPNAVVFALPLTAEYIKEVFDTPNYVQARIEDNFNFDDDEYLITEHKAGEIADELAGFIEEKGYKAISQSDEALLADNMFNPETKESVLPHKTIALLGGAGWIGKNNLFTTPQYGAAQCLGSVLTDAPLETIIHETLLPTCGNCTVCTEICEKQVLKSKTWNPTVTRDEIVDVFGCNTCLKCLVHCPRTQTYMKKISGKMKIKLLIDKMPALFQKTNSNIWTDPYIQQQMLKEHLNPESDGASRKRESILKITDFILQYAKSGSRLLDLGCGPGLYTSAFHEKGYHVTGIDFNQASIEYARSQHKDIRYIEGDYINNYPGGKYETVIMIYCDLGTHSDNDRDILLRNIYNSLEKDGVFIFDVFTGELVKDKHEGKSWEYEPAGGFWNKYEYLLLSQTFHYQENKAFAYQYNLLTEKETKHFILWDRYYSGEEIRLLLKNTGFQEVTIYNNMIKGNTFTSDNEMFVVAKK